jgi:hypothetical protein
MNVGLVACGKTKRSTPSPAEDLYTGQLFRSAREYARTHYDRWYILSAKHGLVAPTTVLEPYEQTLNTMTIVDREAWARRVLAQLVAEGLHIGSKGFLIDERYYFHAGRRYVEFLEKPLIGTVPLAGLGIGQQLAWYKANR